MERMHARRAPSLVFWAAVLWTGIAAGQSDVSGGFDLPDVDPIVFKTLLDREEVRPGSVFRAAVVLTMDPGWHVYANPKGPGIGEATVVAGKDGDGFTFGPARYLPGKKKVADYDPRDWVWAYEGSVPVFLEITAAPDAAPGVHTLAIDVSVLVCKESCLPVVKELAVPVKVAAGESEPAAANAAVFADFDKAAPAPPKETAPAPEEAEEDAGFDVSSYEAVSPARDKVSGLLMAIILGFVAGVLHNVMPCVLPVIGIKIASLVAQAHESRGRVFLLGLAFGAGIMTVFLVLATLAASLGFGWGDLFRKDGFNIVMTGLVFVFALGMFDVYVIALAGGGGAGAREGYLGSFYKGVLATFLATPCSGPFLGATMAWVLSQRPLTIFAVFTTIGLGMAAPYVILSASPGLLRFVPRPGPWMETFKHIMGFVLLGTVVYLFTFLQPEHVWPTLALCLALALGAYLWGRFAHGLVPAGKRWAWRGAIVVGAALAAWMLFAFVGQEADMEWEPLSAEALERYRQDERTVVLDFTAAWCPNCKFVERVVLESAEVAAAFDAKNVARVVADITHAGNASLAIRLRNQLGSRSIPFLAIFPGNDHYRPFVLRDIYSKADVLAILEKCP